MMILKTNPPKPDLLNIVRSRLRDLLNIAGSRLRDLLNIAGSRLRDLLFLLLLFILVPQIAGAKELNPFMCLRDLMPLTDRGAFQKQRDGVEKPFLRDDRYIIFPEVIKRKLSGFFVYDEKGAYYYDSAELGTGEAKKMIPLTHLADQKNRSVFQMVAQPTGLETLTIYYMPDFEISGSNTDGPVVLGSSVLPVVGAFVSRPEKYDYVYQNPNLSNDGELKDWIFKNSSGRRPASAEAVQINRQMVRLKTSKPKSEKRLWEPLQAELAMRKNWVKTHNLDERTFKDLSRALDGSCRE